MVERNTFEWMRALQAPSSSMVELSPGGGPGGLHLTVPNSGSNIAQQ